MTPIFNASYSGLFKMFFDVLELDALAGMPVLIGATGGTARHSLALDHAMRPLFAYLGAAVVPTGVFAATEDWGSDTGGVDGALTERIDRAARDLSAWMVARAPTVSATRSPIRPTSPICCATSRAGGGPGLAPGMPASGSDRRMPIPSDPVRSPSPTSSRHPATTASS